MSNLEEHEREQAAITAAFEAGLCDDATPPLRDKRTYQIEFGADRRVYTVVDVEAESPKAAVERLMANLSVVPEEDIAPISSSFESDFMLDGVNISIIDLREVDRFADTEGASIEEWEQVDLSRPGDTFLPSDALDCGIIEGALRFFAGPKVGLTPGTEYNDEIIRRANDLADTFAAMRTTWPDAGDIGDIKDLGDRTLHWLRQCLVALNHIPRMHLVGIEGVKNTYDLAAAVHDHLRDIGIDATQGEPKRFEPPENEF